MPYLIHTMFWVGVWMPIGATAFVLAKLFMRDAATITVNGQEVTAAELFSYGGAVPLAVGLVGIALAYGIWAERSYPRYLVIIVLVGAAVWANVRMVQTWDVSWTPIAAAIGAIGAVRHLIRNPDVVDYYTRRRAKRAAGQPNAKPTGKDAAVQVR